MSAVSAGLDKSPVRPQSLDAHNSPVPNGLGDIYKMGNAGPKFVGGFSTPDVFADDAMTFERVNDTIRITFGVSRMEKAQAPSDVALVAIGRLILPVASAQRLSLGLHDYLVKQGLDPTALFGEAETAQ